MEPITETALAELQTLINDKQAQMKAIMATAKKEERYPTIEEAEKVDKFNAEIDTLRAEKIKGQEEMDHRMRVKRIQETEDWQNKPQPRKTAPVQPVAAPNAAAISVATIPAEVDDHKDGFTSYGAFAHMVFRTKWDGIPDMFKGTGPTTFGKAGVGADGGFAIPPTFANELLSLVMNEDSLLARTDQNQVAGNTMTFPASEQTPWGGTGVQSFWTSEGAQGTESKPSIAQRNLQLHKLVALVKVTEEMLEDSTLMGNYITTKTADAIRWETNDAIINGTGVGMPLGILNAPCLIESGTRSAGSAFTPADVMTMFARLLPESMGRATWVMHHTLVAKLPLMVLGNAIWTPPNEGFKRAPGGTLLGMPVVVSQTCQDLNTPGDVYLADFSKYLSINKGGVRSEWSVHLHFDYDIQTYRAIFRVDGQPWLQTPVSPANGSSTQSHFVNLAAG